MVDQKFMAKLRAVTMNRKVVVRSLVAATLIAVFAFANHKYKQRNRLAAT